MERFIPAHTFPSFMRATVFITARVMNSRRENENELA